MHMWICFQKFYVQYLKSADIILCVNLCHYRAVPVNQMLIGREPVTEGFALHVLWGRMISMCFKEAVAPSCNVSPYQRFEILIGNFLIWNIVMCYGICFRAFKTFSKLPRWEKGLIIFEVCKYAAILSGKWFWQWSILQFSVNWKYICPLPANDLHLHKLKNSPTWGVVANKGGTIQATM